MTAPAAESVRMFTIKTAAQYLGVKPGMLQDHASKGHVPEAFRDRLAIGSPWRFTKAGLDEFRRRMQSPLGDGVPARPA